MLRICSVLGLVAATLATTAPVAHAGGYDTPMLYSARHMGMGGTAVSFVNDPSALFHNPAGLGRIGRASLMADFSLLLGTIQGSPTAMNTDVESETTVAPFFLLGGAYSPNDWLTLGLAVYPVASAGATYHYQDMMDRRVTDETQLVFFEISPGVALDIIPARSSAELGPGSLTLGISWRVTVVRLTRIRGAEGADRDFDLELSGASFAGLRFGLQWEAIQDHLSIGVSYRHRTETEVSANRGRIFPIGPVLDPETEFVLPSRLTFGISGGTGPFRVATDLEIALTDMGDDCEFTPDPMDQDGCPGGPGTQGALSFTPDAPGATEARLSTPTYWTPAMTLRVGAEYDIQLGDDEDRNIITPRLGYLFDARTANKQYPTAFGTPPGPTHVITFGAGYDGGPWEVNLAYANRFGSATVTPEDVNPATPGRVACAACGFAGDYEIRLHGIYVDFSWDWDLPGEDEPVEEPAPEPMPPVETEPEPEQPMPETEPAPVTEPAPEPGLQPEPVPDTGAEGDPLGEP